MTFTKITTAAAIALIVGSGAAMAKAHLLPGDVNGAAANQADVPGKGKGLAIAGTVSKGGESNLVGVNNALNAERGLTEAGSEFALTDRFNGFGQLNSPK